MLDLYLRPQRRTTLLQRYGEQLGHVVERRLTEIALLAAKQEAERSADAARVALLNAESATLSAEIEADGALKLTVTDTGIGIAADDLEKALAPFSQVDSAYCWSHEGTGLGLPISKALAELHGGSLDMESEPGVGATVTVRFPSERLR